MNKTVRKALLLGLIGFVIGGLVALLMLYLSEPSVFQAGGDHGKILFHFLVSGIYGFIVWSSMLVYEKEEWGIVKVTLLHFIPTMGGFYLMGFLEGWLEFGTPMFFIMTISCVTGYFIIWLIQYLLYKREVARLNRELELMKAAEKDERHN
ncbi:MAG: DUF3021 domain-containing protein [Lachnospiraceae bacterium]|nr:DUF3021 domain-containing protein [Lachnospiraceae bacterium]